MVFLSQEPYIEAAIFKLSL